MCGQFGKNHLGDLDQYLPTNHGFDEFFGNLYHLNAEEEPEHPNFPKDDPAFTKSYSPRGVIHSFCCRALRSEVNHTKFIWMVIINWIISQANQIPARVRNLLILTMTPKWLDIDIRIGK